MYISLLVQTVQHLIGSQYQHHFEHGNCRLLVVVQSNLVTTYTWGLRRFVRCIDRTL